VSKQDDFKLKKYGGFDRLEKTHCTANKYSVSILIEAVNSLKFLTFLKLFSNILSFCFPVLSVQPKRDLLRVHVPLDSGSVVLVSCFRKYFK
jgi:hypothetical protein